MPIAVGDDVSLLLVTTLEALLKVVNEVYVVDEPETTMADVVRLLALDAEEEEEEEMAC